MNLLRILLLSLLMGFTAQAFAQPSTAPDGGFYQSLSQPGQLDDGPHQVEWGLFTHPRLLQMFQRQAPLPEPDYELLLELAVPLAMELQHGYATPRSPQLDWHLKIRPPRSRIGGWKESNALYRHLGTLPTHV
ncbi:hypothetical protein [Ferrimonas balearica]|uniref:hypothetical protein n=1 Tax=Ferrimonas balearica TaxID=44012 RepID=UPI001C94FF63|nr:hypothetical protein [Ferrimonas balearica]MBY6106302.1 hypothetical protein [Ferrimonas balearica]MBY6223119.1 hypothetical protein [Ferrimonas balearica]